MRQHDEPLEEEDFEHFGTQVAADGGCEMDITQRINKGIQ